MTVDSQNALLKCVQKIIPTQRAMHVSWFGGEPLLCPEIIKKLSNKFMQICNIRHLPYSADIVTNGFLLDADMFDMLYKLNVYNYMITVDGFKEQHDRRRYTHDGRGTYDVIVSNLLKIRDNKQYKFANILIRVNMSRGFLEMLDDFVNFLSSSFSDDPRFSIMFIPVVKFTGSEFPNEDIFSDHKELFSYLFKNHVYLNKFYYDELKISSILPAPKCPSALKNAYVITPELNIYKCNAHYNMNANKIGHINERGDLLLDESLHRKWYLSRKYIRSIPESCYACCYLPCCINIDSGCPVSYLKARPEEIVCPMKDTEQVNHIRETVLYAANKYGCQTLNL